jgi:hypothetical protein
MLRLSCPGWVFSVDIVGVIAGSLGESSGTVKSYSETCSAAEMSFVAYITGAVFPAVLWSRVSQVRVRCGILQHRDKP